MKETVFQRVLPTRRAFSVARRQFASLYTLEPDGVQRLRRTWFDTFDQRLRARGLCLELDSSGDATLLRLRGMGNEVECREQLLAGVPDQPLVPPPGELGARLDEVRGCRALLGGMGYRIRVSRWRVVDGEGKVRAILEEEQFLDGSASAAGRTRFPVLRLRALRGYESTCRRLMAEAGLLLSGDWSGEDPADACLRAMHRGRRPQSLPTGPLPLRPRQSGTRALARILLGQLRIIEVNVDGVRDDTDIEFLHDFRVACRRSRSLLTQVRNVLPTQGTGPFREAFAWLSRVTSPQRDLDVFLVALPDLARNLSGRHERALVPLRELLLNRRREEHERLVVALASERFSGFVAQWRQYLSGYAGPRAPGVPGAPSAAVSAARTISRLFRKLLRDGASCGSGDYSPVLHELRKDGKKLRYVLEAYRSLYPPAEAEQVVHRLRRLQGVLGDIVDCHVQRDWLQSWHAEMQARAEGAETLAALDALDAHIASVADRCQRDFQKRFEQFASAPVRDAMEAMLGGRR